MSNHDDFWKQACPARGAGLRHAHWSKCNPTGVHPQETIGNVGKNHPFDMCCHCEMTTDGAVARPSDDQPLTLADIAPSSPTELGMPLEPKMRSFQSEPQGPRIALGRGDLTRRQQATLSTLSAREDFYDWMAAGCPPKEEWFDR
jgi:hypothetical protein